MQKILQIVQPATLIFLLFIMYLIHIECNHIVIFKKILLQGSEFQMLQAFLFAIIFNLIVFLPAFLLKTDKFTDISYSITFLAIATYLFFINPFHGVSLFLYVMICIWALRLGGYLLYRIQKIGRDKRFDIMRHDFVKFLRFWLLQGLTVFIVLIPSIFVFEQPALTLSGFSLVGVCLFFFGIFYEAIADIQKFKFMNTPESQNTFMQSGLWAYSRHPNYFGEICVWLGIYIFCICYLNIGQAIISAISPLFIFVLLRYVSGIPLLEKSAELKFGQNKEYEHYKLNTPRLFPKFWRSKKSNV